MISSPCAMLITPITPKVMASPTAASSSTDPSDSPNQTFCSCAPHRLLALDLRHRRLRRLGDLRLLGDLQRRQRRQRLAAAPPRHHADRRHPVGRAAASRLEQRRRPRLLQRPPDARRPAPPPAPPRSPRAAPGPACGTPRSAAASRRAGSGVHQRQRRDRRADRPAQRVVHLDRIGRARRHRPERRAGQRIEPLGLRPAPGDADHRAVRLARVQVALLQRLQHRRRPLVAGGADRRHHLGAVGEARPPAAARSAPPATAPAPGRAQAGASQRRSEARRRIVSSDQETRGARAGPARPFSVSSSRRRTRRSRR